MLDLLFKNSLQWLFGLLLAPVLAGLVKKCKARLQHRQGPGLLQPGYDLGKLFRKRMVLSETTSWLFRVPPFLEFGIALFLLLVTPGPLQMLRLPVAVDVITILYLMTLGRFFTALAGLDAGSAFGGMGSSREMTIAAMIEPGLVLVLFLVGSKAGTLQLDRMVQWATSNEGWVFAPVHLLAAVAFFILLVAATGRIPVDNPDTHLELTMIHEGMILEYSGPYLALINWAAMIRQYLFFSIFLNIFVPALPGLNWVENAVFFVVKLAGLGCLVALVETLLAKMRLLKVPRLLWAASGFALMALLTVVF